MKLLIKIIILFQCSMNYADSVYGIRLRKSISSINLKSAILDQSNYGDGLYTWLYFDFGKMKYINEMCLSSNQDEMIRGSGKKVLGKYGYSNQGYIQFDLKSDELNHKVIFGRAYIDHGFGKSCKILVSNWSRPFDQLTWQATYKGIRGSVSAVQLNSINNINRYFSIHTIDFDIIKNLTISFGESSIYAGEHRGIEFQYFNPTLFWIPVRENQPEQNQANGFLYLGLKYSHDNFSIWSEYLLDDYQIDKHINEPTTFAFLIGSEIKQINYIINSIWLEYSMAANQTYQTSGDFGEENYLHRNFPIGHYLGNDFDNIVINLNFIEFNIFKLAIEPNLRISSIRDGANGIETPFYAPWDFEENINEDFKFDFPTSPTSNYFEYALTTKLSIYGNSNIELGLVRQTIKDIKSSKTDYSLLFRYYIALDQKLAY